MADGTTTITTLRCPPLKKGDVFFIGNDAWLAISVNRSLVRGRRITTPWFHRTIPTLEAFLSLVAVIIHLPGMHDLPSLAVGLIPVIGVWHACMLENKYRPVVDRLWRARGLG